MTGAIHDREARAGLAAYSDVHSDGLQIDAETTIADLFADLLHIGDDYGVDADRVLTTALMNYQGEKNGDGLGDNAA